MFDERVLVVGTTGDYIAAIQRRFGHRALFVTDAAERARSVEAAPEPGDEVLVDLARVERAIEAVTEHLKRWALRASGVACFDDEALAPAARVAAALRLAGPSERTVAACRDKYVSKELWRRAGLACPAARLVRRADDAVDFQRRVDGPVVLKPLTGSGSQLVHRCGDAAECASAFEVIRSALANCARQAMYAPQAFDGRTVDPTEVFLVEEYIDGQEYSCDFVLDGNGARVLRIARKILDPAQPFGTALGYFVPAAIRGEWSDRALAERMGAAAAALGLRRGLCMADWVIRDGEVYLIELAPRPGGDCLPSLLLASGRMDILGAALDVAEGRPVTAPPTSAYRPMAGLRLLARRGGIVERIDTTRLAADGRLVEYFLKRREGHCVVEPPRDYESRVLGHAIFVPSADEPVERQCMDIAAKLDIQFRQIACPTPSPS